MSSSTSLKEKIEQLMKLNGEKNAQLEYLLKQLGRVMRINRRKIQNSHSSDSQAVDILFNKGSPKSHHSSSLPTLLPSKEIIFYEDEKVNKDKEDLSRFDLPPISDDYGDEKANEVEEDLNRFDPPSHL